MGRSTKKLKTGLAVAAVLSLAACAQSPAASSGLTQVPMNTTAAPSQVVTVAAPSPEPTTEQPLASPAPAASQAPQAPSGVGPSGSFVSKIKDVDGYTFDLDVTVNTSNLGETVANDKPGFMSALFTLGLKMQLVNTTPGRTIAFKGVDMVSKPVGNPKFLVSALWKGDSPVCAPVAAAQNKAPEACAILLGYGDADTPTAVGATSTLKTFKGDQSGNLTAGMAAFPEKDWPAIKAAMAEPAAFMVSYDGGDYQRFDCPMHQKLGKMVGASVPEYECGAVEPELVQLPES
ncbi:hypothetical protein IV500_05485 [Paeniglutamicibacter antarcticus]|uniref:Lipoprotein n=1 Tax=Arthrobacter terrae TaxID=2935737 RepID=A0A931CID3_9MICC|nr:hypothetical protein [Arthrobacter terrae]MBG0738873.1 hypothetical protein [Arthrobacter terrae]